MLPTKKVEPLSQFHLSMFYQEELILSPKILKS